MEKEKFAVLAAVLEDVFSGGDDDEILLLTAAAVSSTSSASALRKQREEHFRLGHLTGDTNHWITRYLDADFHDRFRMKKDTFGELVTAVRPSYPDKLVRGSAAHVDCTKAVLMKLTYLGRQMSMDDSLAPKKTSVTPPVPENKSDVGDTFGVAVSTVHKEVHLIVKILCDLRSTYIVWPTANECSTIQQQFRERAGFPGQCSLMLKGTILL
ncbi:hypothetical protein FOCC_FOCC016484 [Frankliniella occidentalis]|nr:hypothetical protein FOCC_FOCC016484 [Frankliniella occidentalis]